MTLRPTEPDFDTLVGATEDDEKFEAKLKRFHRQRYDRGQYHDPGAQLDLYEEAALTWRPEPWNSRARVVVLDEFLPYPLRAAEVAAAKAEGDRYRAISRAYAGLE